jgi:tetratricopeptide (TPR) repeat protein
LTPTSFAGLTAAVSEAEQHLRAGDWRSAQHIYRSLLIGGLAEAGSSNRELLAERLADIAVTLGDFKEAADWYNALFHDLNTEGEWTRADIVLLKRIHIALSEERLDNALVMLRGLEARIGPLQSIEFSPTGLIGWEARVLWDGSARPFALANFYLEGGRILGALGQYSEAIVAFRRGLEHCAGVPELDSASAAVRLSVAAALVERGDLAVAREELLQVTPDGSLPAPPAILVGFREISAKLDLLQGNFASAEFELSSVVEVCRALGAVRGAARAAINLAELQVILNRIPEANANLEAASALGVGDMGGRIARIRELARNRAGAALGGEPLALPVLSMQSLRGNVVAAAEPVSGESAAAIIDGSRPTSYLAFYEMREMEVLAKLAAGQGEFARSSFGFLVSDFGSAGSMLIRTRLRVLEAVLEYDRAAFRTAETLLRVARDELRRAGLRPELYQCGRLLALCQEKLGFPATHVLQLREENDALLDEISHSLGPEERDLYLLDKWSARETVLGREIDEFAQLQADAGAAMGWRRLSLEYRILVRLNTLINRVSDLRRSGEVSSDQSKPLWRRLLMQTPARSEIGFLLLPNCTMTWQAGWLSLRCRITPTPRLRIRELVAAWQRDAPAPDPRSRNRAVRTSRELAASLGVFELFGGVGKRVRHVTFYPDDQLFGFPFAALPLSKELDAPCAGTQWATSVAFPERGATVRSRVRVRVAAVAGVPQATGFRALPDLPAQNKLLCQWLKSRGIAPEVLLESQVTRKRLLEVLRNCQLFHYGGHGVLSLDNPELSGLVLAERDSDGQLLSLRDIISVPLRDVEHATVAACWAADGFAFPGGRTVGFTRLLIGAGVGSVLAPLWEIDDRLAGMFLQKFYQELPGKSRGEALRLARQHLIKKGYTEPFWWAGFQLYGDHGPLLV